MSNNFISVLQETFEHSHTFTKTKLKDANVYVNEVEIADASNHKIKQTVFANTRPATNHFHIVNSEVNNEITHICIDGDYIVYGKEKYDLDSSKQADGRPDAVIFDKNRFLF